MLFDNEINVCAISAIRQFDVAEATATATIVDQYIIRFDICYQESGAVRRGSGAMASHVPVCTIPSSCKAASALIQPLQHASLLEIEAFWSLIRLTDCYQDAPRLAKEDIGLRQSGGGEMIYFENA